MAEHYAPGDIVELISGGPKMTVKSSSRAVASSPPSVTCQWFAGGTLKVGHFHPDSIRKVSEKSGK